MEKLNLVTLYGGARPDELVLVKAKNEEEIKDKVKKYRIKNGMDVNNPITICRTIE